MRSLHSTKYKSWHGHHLGLTGMDTKCCIPISNTFDYIQDKWCIYKTVQVMLGSMPQGPLKFATSTMRNHKNAKKMFFEDGRDLQESWLGVKEYLFSRKRVVFHLFTLNSLLLSGYFSTKSSLGGKLWCKIMQNLCLSLEGVFSSKWRILIRINFENLRSRM